jgi:site-specific recombinase XerD
MSRTRRKPGRLGPYVEGYRTRLVKLGYRPSTIYSQLQVLGQLGRWMEDEELMVSQLSRAGLESFRAARRAGGYRRVPGLRSLDPLMDFLRDEAALPVAEPVCATPLDELMGRYREWMVQDRALASATVVRYECLARRFVEPRVSPEDELGIKNLGAQDVSTCLLRECARLKVGSAKARVVELRSLLRFLYLRGLTPLDLATALPSVAGWRDTGLPVGLAASDVARLLDSCDRSAPGGARDFAILMLLARLGLRSAEVAALELDDLNWRAGELLVRGKGGRRDLLPLPADVGQALATYLSVDGERGTCRRVFLTVRPPRRPIRSGLVSDVVRQACRRAGLAPIRAHRLRHCLATEMLRKGASLVAISQVLRHRDLATTAAYAKADLSALRELARPWPGVAR